MKKGFCSQAFDGQVAVVVGVGVVGDGTIKR
jgi:hypothetical protein